MKKRAIFLLTLCLLALLAGCGKDKNAASAEAAQQKPREHSYWDILPSYKPHSVFRVRRFLSSEGAERNGQMGLLQTRSRHNRLQFRLLQ